MSLEDLLWNWSDYAVFPCKPNTKIPATQNGFKDAKFGQDVQQIIAQGYNVGVALATSGLIAVDLDYHCENATPEEDLKNLEAELGSKLPRTLTQSTASGKGKHLIFSAKGITNPIGRIGKFIDVKHNGYIMIAPSVFNGRQYQIIDGVDENGNFIIAELPQAWLDYINKNTASSQKISQKTEKTFYENIDTEKMFSNCAFLSYCKENADCLSEPEWFTMISILAPIRDADGLIHTLSEPYPRYSFEETQKKIENARKFGHSQTCAYISAEFSEICANCKYITNRKDM